MNGNASSYCCGRYARSFASGRRSGALGSRPKQRTVPTLGSTSPAIARTSVVLPAPFGPTTTTRSPASTPAVTPRTTGFPPSATSTAVSSTHTPLFLPSSNAGGNAVRTRVLRRRNDRVVMNLPVELISNGKKIRAVSQDISPLGMFVRLSPPLPPGTIVQIVLSPNGQRHAISGQVTHMLSEAEARTLGRFPGIGVMFRDPVRPADEEFLDAITRLLETNTPVKQAADLRILVADPQTRLLERLSTA